MINLLFVTNHLQFSDGVSKSLLNLTNNLDKTKYCITIVSLFIMDKEFIKLFDKKIKIRTIFNCYFRGLSRIAGLIPNYILLKKIIKNDEYDIVISYQHGLPTKSISKAKNIKKKIAFMHGYTEDDKKFHKNFNKIVCVSEDASKKYKKGVIFPEKITFCHNIVEGDKIISLSKKDSEFSKLLKDIKPLKFCYVGRLSSEKGLDRALIAFSKLKSLGYDFMFVIVGDGPEKTNILNLIKKYCLGDNVLMVGMQKNPYNILKLCDVYLCSSYQEGLSTSCIESSILNIPIISTNVSGANEIVKNLEIGIVVENDDDALFYGLKKLLDNGILDLWRDNFNITNKKWDSKIIINRFNEIIMEVLNL